MSSSILINNYNNGPWLRECVDSALLQTRPADEIIVYDDGSTDDSLTILRSYGDRITLIEGQHDSSRAGVENQSAAIHAAFLASTGDHLHLLDGDDAYLPDRLEHYESLWSTQPEAMMVHGPLQFIDGEGNSLKSDGYRLLSPEDHLAWIYRHHRPEGFFATSALAFHRRFLEEHLPVEFTDHLHLPLDSRLSALALLTSPILLLREPHTLYRKIPNSISSALRIQTRAAVTRLNCQGFNLMAAKVGRPLINYWYDRRYFRQRLRELAPKQVGDFFAGIFSGNLHSS